MRKARFDHEEALKMIKQGVNLGKIAKKFNVSRQAIYNLKRDAIKRGLLGDVKAKRNKPIVKHDGKTMPLRGKLFSVSEVLEAMPLKDYLPQLSDAQLNEIAYNILDKARLSSDLEEKVREIPNLRESIRILQKQLEEAKQGSLRKRLKESDTEVTHGE